MTARLPSNVSKKKPTSAWFVYMLECTEGLIYTGITTDMAARFEKHCTGRGAAFTRMNKPLRVMAAMPRDNRSEASKTEAALKKLRRPEKLLWAAQWPWPAANATRA